jgi:hypothetical protein
MSDNAVNKSINLPLAEDEETVQENTFPLAIKELGEALFEDYEDKTSNLSEENILGTIRCDAINEYMEITYGYRYASLDVIVQKKMARNLSNNGFGIERLIEIVKSVQASFQAVEQPSMGQQMLGRR